MTTKVSDYRHDLGLKKVKVKYICKNYLNSSCIVSRNFLLRHLSKTYPMKSIQEHLRQLLQIFSTSKTLQVPLCLDSLFEINHVQGVNQNVTLHRPNSINLSDR